MPGSLTARAARRNPRERSFLVAVDHSRCHLLIGPGNPDRHSSAGVADSPFGDGARHPMALMVGGRMRLVATHGGVRCRRGRSPVLARRKRPSSGGEASSLPMRTITETCMPMAAIALLRRRARPLLLGRRKKQRRAVYHAAHAVTSDHECRAAADARRRRFSSARHSTATATKLAHAPGSRTIRKKTGFAGRSRRATAIPCREGNAGQTNKTRRPATGLTEANSGGNVSRHSAGSREVNRSVSASP
jgi:hypothetical protein